MQKRLNTSKSKISCTTKSQAVPTTRITDSRACQLQEKKGSCHTHRHMSNNFVGKKGALALSQIIILLVGIFAFTWSIGIVSGGAMPEENPLENLVCESCPQSSSSNIPTSTGKNTATTITSGYTPAQLEKAIKKATESVGEEINNLNKEIAGLEEAGTTSTEKISELGSQLTNKEKELANLQACVKDSGGAGCKDVIEKGTTSKGGSSTLSEWLGIEKLPEGQTAEFWTWQQGGFADGIISGAQYGLMTYGAVKMLGPMLGLDEEETDAASVSLGAGVGVGKLIYTLLGKGGALSGEGTMNTILKFGGKLSSGLSSVLWGAIVAYILWKMLYEEVEYDLVTFTCEPWEAPVGGSYCEECNNQGILPCSEYQCRSLGQACELLNQGTDEEACTWVNRYDVEYPIIEPWQDALLDSYDYTPDNTISPPDRGVKIVYTDSEDNCIPAFSAFSFGVTVNEPAKCKIDYIRKETFDEMDFWFGGNSLFRYNHTQTMSLPGLESLSSDNLTVENDGEFTLYTRCQDANGNSNTATFVFKYCVDKGPDTTPPMIVDTSIKNNMPIAYNTSSVDLEVYVNEPSECKWSHTDQSYDNMEEQMSCSTSVTEMNARLLYTCTTTLTGLKDKQDNDFYFRCKDQPSSPDADRNVNTESYEFVIIGTQPLVIDEAGPNETIKDSTDSVKVTLTAETSAGYNEGDATCYYSETDYDDDYIMFFYEEGTSSYTHAQDLWLGEGDYFYYIKCIDLGGNMDKANVSFSVDSDTDSPVIVRAYHEDEYLKLITDETAECVYDTTSCSYDFEDGIKLTTYDDVEHYTEWNTEVDLFVKCQDEFGNQPLPNACSIIARPFEIFEE